MSIAIVEREVLKFLRSDEPGVLCITGTWGVGKTHAWTRRYLARARAESIASVSKYSYVSLFGLNSLEQFRQNLIIGALTRDLDRIAPGSIFDKGKRMLQSLAEPLQKFSKFGQYSGLLASVAFNLLDGQLFCIDDLERKGVGLSIKDILGLVTQLKEEKKCKVVIILNVGDLEGTDKDEFQTYHEKVIDLSLTYAPTPEECAHIALSNSEVDQLIAKCAVELRISNIRILKKIQARVVQIAELVGDYDTRIFEPIVRSIVLLSWCVYAPTEAPSLEFLKAYQLRGVRKGNEAQPGPAETQWNSVLTSYGFSHFDEFDSVITSGIKDGFFDETSVKSYAAAADAKLKAQNEVRGLQNAWAMLYGSFDNNHNEVVNAFVEGASAAGRYMTVHDIFSVISVLKRFGEQERARAMIAGFIRAHEDDDRDFFDIDGHPFGSLIADDDLREALRRKLATFEDQRAPEEILIKMSRTRGWTPEDIASLSTLTEDDFYRIFKTAHGDDLNAVVLPAVQFAQIGGIGPTERRISATARAALKRIGQESEINKVRVLKYGVPLDNGVD